MKEFNYNVSILIPVYNAQSTLDETVQSILAQKVVEGFTYEVLLINDGSVDESEEICLKYANEYPNIKYFKHENRGVSYTRNRGMDLAEGKYILFLDADDLIGEETLNSVFKTFEKYKDYSNILGYPIYSLANGEVKEHPRTKNYDEEAVYDVDDYAFFNQVTMNIVIKNLKNKTYFDEALFQSEDALFNTMMIFHTRKLIICNKGAYFYRNDQFTTVQKYTNPAIIGNKLLELFEKYYEKFSYNKQIPPYVQSSILYEINWRFKANSLYPFHLKGEQWIDWENRFNKILGYISEEVILQQPFMDYYHKFYFIEKKNKGNLKVDNDSLKIYIRNEEKLITEFDEFTLVFEQIKIKNKSEISLLGYIKAPLLTYLTNITLVIYKDDKEYLTIDEFFLAADSRYKSKQITNVFHGFKFTLPLDFDGQYKFVVKYNGLEYDTTHYFSDHVIFKKYLKQNYILFEGKYISYYSNPFCINIVTPSKLSYLKNYLIEQQQLITNGYKYIAAFKMFMTLGKEKEIWLYNDRINIFDNAYLQFKHDFNKKDGVKRYYVTYENEDITNKFNDEEKKYLVLYNSLKHKQLVYRASLILTSFQNVYEYCPFMGSSLNALYDGFNYKVVYLQHGILHAHTPWLYSKEKTKIDYFLTSSEYEKNMLMTSYNYTEENIINLLMPRFENSIIAVKENKILFAPSWRISLTNGIKDLVWQLDEVKFKQSTYFQEINQFINNQKLIDLLEENDLIIDFNLHPIFKEYSSSFECSSSRVRLVTEAEDISIYKAFVTDFSSFVFDFVKLNIPVMFFIPDENEFLSGNHIYNKLELNLQETFGPYTISQEILVENLEELILNDFLIPEEYKSSYKTFFNKVDSPKEELYKALKNYQMKINDLIKVNN